MKILNKLQERWHGIDYPFLIHSTGQLYFSDIEKKNFLDLSQINSGDVVALIGDFDPQSIFTFIMLIDKNVIIVPLTIDTKSQHEYFFETAFVDVIVEGATVTRINNSKKHEYIENLRFLKRPGLVLFSTGTTGKPKAI